MATYLYETIPQRNGEAVHRFEVVQSMKDAPLTKHPDTGEPVRRVISGGFGYMEKAGPRAAPALTAAAPCMPGCACHSGPRVPAS